MYVQEEVTHFYTYLLYKMGQYLLDRRYVIERERKRELEIIVLRGHLSAYTCLIISWYLYKMVAQNMLRTYGVK